MKELKYLNKYFLRYKYRFILGVIFVVVSNLFAIIPAQVVRQAVDFTGNTFSLINSFEGFEVENDLYEHFLGAILFSGLLIIGMAVLTGLFQFFMRQTLIVMSRLIEYDLKNDLYVHYQSLPLSFYKKNKTGDLMARVSEDVGKVSMYLGPAVMYSINTIVSIILVISIMFSVNVKLTIYVLIPLPILSLSIYYVNNMINKRSMAIQKQLSTISTNVQETFSGIRVIKAFSREKEYAQIFDHESEKYRKKSLALAIVNALFFPVIMFLISMSVILTVYIGGTEVIDGVITPGNIVEFILYVNMLVWPVTSLGWVTSITQQASASQKRINEFMNISTDIVSEEDLNATNLNGKVEFKNVSFTYEDSGVEALKNVSFEIEPGQTLAILGTTGSGKSTLANLLCRMYDPSSGDILMDGQNIKKYNIQQLRSNFGYVPQEVFLFSDTIRNNIAFGKDDATEEEIIQAAKDADLYENVNRFPDQFGTVLGERGITLSGGQKQRTSIARALCRKPKVMILDDCLSAVDTNTENRILSNLNRIMTDKTSIVISHRVSSTKLADKILVLDDGEVIQSGTHSELIQKEGVYKELYEKQLETKEG